MSLALLQTIALLCQFSVSVAVSGGSKNEKVDTVGTQINCQQHYIRCVASKPGLIEDTKLTDCVLEMK